MSTTLTIIFTIIFVIALMIIALKNKLSNHRLHDEIERLKDKLVEAENEKESLRDKMANTTNEGGIGESTVLAVASEIARMENNLYHMEEVPGRKQVSKALDRMKVALQAEGYTVIPLLGTPYKEGMQMTATFVSDENLPPGSSVITSVQKPQVNHNGKMIQAACVTVGQNI